MSSDGGAVPVLYDDFDSCDTRLDPALLAAGVQAHAAYASRGGTALMVAALAPVSTAATAPILKGPAAACVAANLPNRIQIRVSPQPADRVRAAHPTTLEWAVAVSAGLVAAVLIGVVAALV